MTTTTDRKVATLKVLLRITRAISGHGEAVGICRLSTTALRPVAVACRRTLESPLNLVLARSVTRLQGNKTSLVTVMMQHGILMGRDTKSS